MMRHTAVGVVVVALSLSTIVPSYLSPSPFLHLGGARPFVGSLQTFSNFLMIHLL